MAAGGWGGGAGGWGVCVVGWGVRRSSCCSVGVGFRAGKVSSIDTRVVVARQGARADTTGCTLENS